MSLVFLSKSVSLYLKNFRTALAFAILLVFVLFFSAFDNLFVSSGSIFLSYSFSSIDAYSLVLPLLGVLVFLLLYSLFVTVIVFSVRKELSTVRMNYYLTEALRMFAFKLFLFFVLLSVALFVLSWLVSLLSLPSIVFALLGIAVAVATMFVPQSIVVDEHSLVWSLFNNFEFISKKPKNLLLVLVLGVVLLGMLQWLEFALDRQFLLGNYVSLLLVLVFVQPFLEVLKTYLYIVEKFELIGQHELKSGKL